MAISNGKKISINKSAIAIKHGMLLNTEPTKSISTPTTLIPLSFDELI